MAFNNPIVGGTTLIREAIKSPNYVPGVSGWSINKDGSAEFNDVTIRGSLIVDGDVTLDANDVFVVENTAGDPVLSITDSQTETWNGISLERILSIYGYSAGALQNVLTLKNTPSGSFTNIEMSDKRTGSLEVAPVSIGLDIQAVNVNDQPTLSVFSSTNDLSAHQAALHLVGDSRAGGNSPEIRLENSGATSDIDIILSGRVQTPDQQHVAVEEGTNITAFTNTVFQGGTPDICGLTFVAPASGKGYMHWHARLSSNTANTAMVSVALRTGGTIGSGTVVHAASVDWAVETPNNGREQSAMMRPVSGLTPGNTYNIRVEHAMNGGGDGTVFFRSATWIPST